MESVRRFVEICARKLNWNKKGTEEGIIWEGKGLSEIGIRADTGETVIKIDPNYFRPTEVDTLLGDATQAKKKLGWEPKTTLEELIDEMLQNDIHESEKESFLKKKGY